MAGEQAVDINFEIKNKILAGMMDTPLNLSKKKKLKRLKSQGKLSRIHGASLNKSGRGNLSLNSTFIRQTLKANNRNLAKTLESVRRELKMCQQEKLEAMRETHELREEVRKLQRVCGLKNNEIEQEVNLRIAERMAEVKNFIVKASQGLQNTVPLLMQGLMLCSGPGRSSSVGSYLSNGDSRSSTESRINSPVENTVSNVTRRSIFGTATVSEKSEESPKAVRPVRSAMPTSQPSTSTASESGIVNNVMPPTSVRPSDLCYTDLSMIMEQSHLGDLDLDDLDGISTGRRSSRQRLSRKTKSRGRRSTVHGSRSLEMFQQSLVENSSQEESQVSETGVQAGETPENRVSQGDEKAPGEEGHIEKESAEVNMETDAVSTTDLPLVYECKLNDVEEGKNTEDDVKIKSRRTRSRSMNRAKSSGRETRSKRKTRERDASPESDLEDDKSEENLTEQNIRSSSRMSRRDSYEQTMLQKSAEKSRSRSSRSLSRRKSKKVMEENEVEPNIQEEQAQKIKEPQKENESDKRRRSKRKTVGKEVENSRNEFEKTAEDLKENKRKGYESKQDCATIEEPMSRRKSKRTIAKDVSSNDDDMSPENIRETHHQDKKEVKKPSRKSKRFAVEEDVEISEAAAVTVQNSEKPIVGNSNGGDITNEMPSQTESEVEMAEIIHADKKGHKRKSRRIASALNVHENTVDVVNDTASTVVEKEETVTNEDNSNGLKRPEKERRGTFVVNKVTTHVDKQTVEMIDKDKKHRRGTFVVPTAPPPAPKTKKTMSNIPILEGRGKAAEEKETKRKLEKDRRGTYFAPKPVTPYLDVENIEDIEADSLLVSLTDEDTQNSVFLSGDKEQKSQNETEEKDALRITVPPKMPSPTSHLGETTVLEPQDMELTEALPVVSRSRFSAPEPEFLKNISPGPATLTRPIDLNKTVALEKPKEHPAESQIAADKCNSEDYVPDSDLEEEKEKSKDRNKSTKIKDKGRTTDKKPDRESEKADKNQVEVAVKDTSDVNADIEVIADTSQPNRARSKKFKLMKAADNGLGPSDTESVTSKTAVSEGEENANKQPVDARRSRRSTKPVIYTESNSDEDDSEEKPEPDKADKSGKEEKISDLLKAKSRQKFQAWLSKPGDIKFTGGKRDVTTQLMEDLTKHHRSKSKDRSTIIPKPRARSRSRSRSRPRIPLPSDDSPKSEFDFVGTPPQDRLKQLTTSPSGRKQSGTMDGISKTPNHISYSEFRGRTPMRKSMNVQQSDESQATVVLPLEPKKTNCPEEEEFTVHDHGIMLLLGNGRRTKPRTKGKSVCMAPEKSDIHLITPMVGKTQAMPRTPPPHGDAKVNETPPEVNIVLKPPPPPVPSIVTTQKPVSDFQKPTSVAPHKSKATNREQVISVPESPMVSPQKTSSSSTCCLDAARRSKSSDKYFGFEVDDEDSVFQTQSPSPCKSLFANKKKQNVLPRKSLMEGKPKTDCQSQSSQNSDDSPVVKVKASQKSVKKKRKIESDPDEGSSPQAANQAKSTRSERGNRSRSRVRHGSVDKENETTTDSSPSRPSTKTPATKTPAASKSSKSAKGKSSKKATKTPGTTKKTGRVTLTNLKRKLEIIKSKTASADDESEDILDANHSQDVTTKKSNAHRRLYEDVKTKTTEESYESGPQKRKSDNREHSAGVFQDASSPKRPRRAASKVACYIEPSLGSKLRQGDPGTSTIYEGGSGEDLKSLVRKSKGSSRKRDALHTVTNIKI